MNYKPFLTTRQFELLGNLKADATPKWGIMSAQHMVEHICVNFLFSIEKVKVTPIYEEERLQRNYDYTIRDKNLFKKNIKLKGLEKPLPLRFASLEEAISKLKTVTEKFYTFFQDNKEKKTAHPAFGMLSYTDWEYLLYAHNYHHCLQFGLLDEA